eukprot:PhM_4_TR836/c0_g1_i1/m.59584
MLRRTQTRQMKNLGDFLSFGFLRPDYVVPTARFADAIAIHMRRWGWAICKFGDKFMGERPLERIIRMRRLITMNGVRPQVGENCFIAPSAVVIGNVKIARKCPIFYNAIVRGDAGPVIIGEGSGILEKAVVKGPTTIGQYCTIEPMAIVDSATIGSGSFVGGGSIVCRGATIESGSMLCAAAVLRSGAVLPAGEMWAGNPAQKVADLTDQEKDHIVRSAKHNILIGVEHHDAWSFSWEEIENHRIAREVWARWAQQTIEFRVRPFYVRGGPAAKGKADNPLEIREGFNKFQREKDTRAW